MQNPILPIYKELAKPRLKENPLVIIEQLVKINDMFVDENHPVHQITIDVLHELGEKYRNELKIVGLLEQIESHLNKLS